jgi:glycerol-3-phosphate acyltransferase PlsX
LNDSLTIALDAMGGDHAPHIVVRGANMARRRFPNARFLMFGDERRVAPLLRKLKRLRDRCTIRHTESFVTNEAKPSVAVRQGRQSSMQLAINAVRDGEAHGIVSAGNTGALMAMAMLTLKTLPGIDRPAIAAIFPNRLSECVMLDLGANVEADAYNLIQFCVLGEVFARSVLGRIDGKPSVGLLNVGTEDVKGHDAVRQAATMLRELELPIRFHGFVEGDDIAKGTVDVIVTDGFTGNIALKTIEGSVRLYSDFLRKAFTSSIAARLGYMLARRGLKKLKARVDPRRYNGAVFLGLNGIVVKSHGGTDAFGFANAIGVAVDMARQGYNQKIIDELALFGSDRLSNSRLVAS